MKRSFLGKRIQSVKYAAKGAWLLIKNEPSIRVQVIVACGITCAGFYFNISKTEWIVQLLIIGLVLAAEGLNTAIEAIADYMQPKLDPKIGYIKDVAAGAVFFAAIAAIIIACIIYIPKF